MKRVLFGLLTAVLASAPAGGQSTIGPNAQAAQRPLGPNAQIAQRTSGPNTALGGLKAGFSSCAYHSPGMNRLPIAAATNVMPSQAARPSHCAAGLRVFSVSGVGLFRCRLNRAWGRVPQAAP